MGSSATKPKHFPIRRKGVKVDENGTYLPFYGYTAMAMVEHPQEVGNKIEDFIRTSSLGQYFAPLPHDTYHMTIFNIYAIKCLPPIPPVRKWLDDNPSATLPSTGWLPTEVLSVQNKEATQILKKIPDDEGVKAVTFNTTLDSQGLSVLKLQVSLDDTYHEELLKVRNNLSCIYGHNDQSFNINGYHITLGYSFKEPIALPDSKLIAEDLKTLSDLVQSLASSLRLVLPGVYLFDSMVNFELYSQ